MSWHDARAAAGRLMVITVAALGSATAINYLLGRDPAAFAAASGIALSGALVLSAALVNVARPARAEDDLWPVVVVLSSLATLEVVLTTLSLLGHTAPPSVTAWMVGVPVAALGAFLCLMAPRIARAVRRRGEETATTPTHPLAAGAAIGLVAALALMGSPLATTRGFSAAPVLLSVALLGCYAAGAVAIYASWPCGRLTRGATASALLFIGGGKSFQHLDQPDFATFVAVEVQLAAAGLLVGATYTVVRQVLADHRRRLSALREQVLSAQANGRQRADQHAIRNLVAGISLAAELLNEPHLEEPIRRRLEQRIMAEAEALRHHFEQPPAATRASSHGSAALQPVPLDQPVPERSSRPLQLFTAETHV